MKSHIMALLRDKMPHLDIFFRGEIRSFGEYEVHAVIEIIKGSLGNPDF